MSFASAAITAGRHLGRRLLRGGPGGRGRRHRAFRLHGRRGGPAAAARTTAHRVARRRGTLGFVEQLTGAQTLALQLTMSGGQRVDRPVRLVRDVLPRVGGQLADVRAQLRLGALVAPLLLLAVERRDPRGERRELGAQPLGVLLELLDDRVEPVMVIACTRVKTRSGVLSRRASSVSSQPSYSRRSAMSV